MTYKQRRADGWFDGAMWDIASKAPDGTWSDWCRELEEIRELPEPCDVD